MGYDEVRGSARANERKILIAFGCYLDVGSNKKKPGAAFASPLALDTILEMG
jgi:hypothetical protein